MYILEGNIGAGKSTFLQLINTHLPHVQITLEPHIKWQKQMYGQSLLANFYKDPKRWAYTIETFTMTCRVRQHLVHQLQSNSLSIVERSIYSGHYCFAKNCYEQGFMSLLEWQMYIQWFNLLIDPCKPPYGFIYLLVDPKVAYKRIKKRNRHSEKNLTLAYLKQIDQKYQEFLIHKKDIIPSLQDVPLLVLDCNEEFEDNPKNFNKHLQDLEVFIENQDLALVPAQKTVSI